MVYSDEYPYDNKLIRLFAGHGWTEANQYNKYPGKMIFSKLISDNVRGCLYSMQALIDPEHESKEPDIIQIAILSFDYRVMYGHKFEIPVNDINDENFVYMVNVWINVTNNRYAKFHRESTEDNYEFKSKMSYTSSVSSTENIEGQDINKFIIPGQTLV